mgnify:CR=1 FL=1
MDHRPPDDRRSGPGDRRGDERPRSEGRDDRGGRGGQGGGPDTRFLELEMSKLLYEEASGTTREALRDLIKESVTKRLRERLGDRIEALGRLAADELVDMIEANLAIEARVADYHDGREKARDRLREIFAREKRPDRGGDRGSGETRRDPEDDRGGGEPSR